MNKACALAVLAAALWGCAVPTAAWKGKVEWPDEHSSKLVVSNMEAGAALAAAAAIREMLKTNTDPGLFSGCASPEQGLDVAVFTGPTPGLYYVKLNQHFSRCGGPRGRVLDWWYVYAVTPQGEVVAEAPVPPAEEAFSPPPSPPRQPEPTPSPVVPPASPEAEPPLPVPTPGASPLGEPPSASPLNSGGTKPPETPHNP